MGNIKIHKIIHRGKEIWVRPMRVDDLNVRFCNDAFVELITNHPTPEVMFIKCDDHGKFDLRLKNNGFKYRFRNMMNGYELLETKEIPKCKCPIHLLDKVKQQPKSDSPLGQQLKDLRYIGDIFGLHDATKVITNLLRK